MKNGTDALIVRGTDHEPWTQKWSHDASTYKNNNLITIINNSISYFNIYTNH